TLTENIAFKNAVAMCILQIGELTTHFSKDFLEHNKKVPWGNMKRMRNIAAHHYGCLLYTSWY
ncbi:HepT-like ribonuclease domain-containing protein, partial [Treponema sp. R8-4-B8]